MTAPIQGAGADNPGGCPAPTSRRHCGGLHGAADGKRADAVDVRERGLIVNAENLVEYLNSNTVSGMVLDAAYEVLEYLRGGEDEGAGEGDEGRGDLGQEA